MRHTGLLIGSLLSVFVFARPALAQDEYAPDQGNFRIGLSGLTLGTGAGANLTSIDGTEFFNIGIGFDYFLTRNVTLNLGVSWLKVEDFDLLQYSAGIGYYFSAGGGNVTPFVRVGLTGFDFEAISNETGFYAAAGVNIFVNPNISFDITVGYTNISDTDALHAGLGLSIWFR